MRRLTTLVLMLALAGTILQAAPAPLPASSLTVGEFMLMYAGAMHLQLPAGAGAETAMAALKAAKAIPSEPFVLENKLTHKDVLRIARGAGLKVTSSTPDREFGRAEAELFLDTYSRLIASVISQPDRTRTVASSLESEAPGNANTSKGKKKGRPFQSPNEP